MRWVSVSFTIVLFVASCGDDHHGPTPTEDHCNPLGFETHCSVPWPSSVYEVADATTPTGRRLALDPEALPKNFNGTAIDPAMWNLADGFSPSAPLIAAFPGGVSPDGLVTVDNLDPSLAADSPTVILDLTANQRVAHASELDSQAGAAAAPDSQALFLRPGQRLVGGHHYAAAITTRVKAKGGGALPISPGFQALRDGTPSDDTRIEAMRADFDTVLDALDTAGFPRTDLVLAWDFTVASDEFLHREMTAARDRAVAAMDAHGDLHFTIKTDVSPDPKNAGIARFVTGTLEAPLFLTTADFNVPGTTTVRDADNLPVVQGFYDIPFSAVIPECALTSPTPVPMILYGHGLLGDSTEVDCCGVPPVANDLCMVIVGTDMRGMSENDVPAVADALNDATKADGVFEVLEQGIANHVVLARAMRTTMAQTLFVDAANGNKVLVDRTKVFYWGLSQGGIFGASVMAYEPAITRGVLGSGAADYSFLLDRSTDWAQYQTILAGAYPDPLDDELIIGLMQMRWDKTEPAGIVGNVLDGSVSGTDTQKHVMMQIAWGDEQVSDYAAFWEARSMGVSVVGTGLVSPWGIPVQDAATPMTDGLMIYGCGAVPPPLTNTPPETTACPMANRDELHDLPAHVAAGRRQMAEFFSSGSIENQCAGSGDCTCDTGACD